MNQPGSNYFNRNSLINRPFSWQGLRRFGSSKIVKSSYYWIFLIPLFSKVATQLHPVLLNIPGFGQTADFSLPFSWFLLYFSALSFALASLLYDIFCPRIISTFKDFREFLDSGYESLFLVDELDANVRRDTVHDSSIYQAFILEWDKLHQENEFPPGIDPHARVCLGLREIDRNNFGGIFYALTTVANHSHPTIMRITGTFYYLGFGLLLVVLLQNFNSVVIEILGGTPLFCSPLYHSE
jgi:hypothetical protein